MDKEGSIVKRTWRWGKRSFGVLTANKYTTIAGTLTFFLVMSFVPFVFWLMLLLSRAGIEVETILELELFGWAKDFLILIIKNAEGAFVAGAGVVFLATTFWSSSAFFYHLRKSGEILYDYRRKKHGWKVRLSAIILTFAVLIFFLIAIAAFISVSVFARRLPRWLYYLIIYSLVLTIGLLAAWILNAYILPYRSKPVDTLPGSLLTALAWLLASAVFLLYFRFTNKERLYGALSLVIVFLLWLYWMMICFTAGAVYNRHRINLKGLEHKKL